MSLKAKTVAYATCRNDHVKRKVSLLPNMSSNGTWMAEGAYSCRGSSSLRYVSNLYKVFNGQYYSSDVSDFNEDIYIDICLPKALALCGADMYSYYQALPAIGIVYYSDDGETYTECGAWKDETTTSQNIAVTWDNVGAHRIWRFVSTSRSNKYPTKNADITYASLWYYDEFDIDYSLPDGVGGFQSLYATCLGSGGVNIKQDIYLTCRSGTVDYSLPEGIGGFQSLYATLLETGGVKTSQDVYFTYKRDDLVNLWEGKEQIDFQVDVDTKCSSAVEQQLSCDTDVKTTSADTLGADTSVKILASWQMNNDLLRAVLKRESFSIAGDTERSVHVLRDMRLNADTQRGLYAGQKLLADTARIVKVHIEPESFSVSADTAGKITASYEVDNDLLRKVYKRAAFTISGDTARIIRINRVHVYAYTSREIVASYNISSDLVRLVQKRTAFSILGDTERIINAKGNIVIHVDTVRKLKRCVELGFDTELKRSYEVICDTAREIYGSFGLLADTCMRYPFDTTFTLPANKDTTPDPFAVPKAVQQDGMVSMSISLNELSLSDTFELETTMQVEVLDAIYGTILDFPYSYTIGETSWSGRSISASGMYDVDSLLYTPMTYTTADVKHKASWHARKIADSLGKNLNLAISDFTHSSTWVGAGQTYESIISSLFGWTSAIPHKQINVFMRAAGNTLNIVQRGQESRVTDITDTHHTRPEYHREVVRTMWSYRSDDGSGSSAHGINIEPVPFTGTLSFGDAQASYSGGYLTSETVNGEVTTYSYSGISSARYVTGKVCVHKDGSITKTDYNFASTAGGIGVLGSEVETTTDKSGNSQTVRKTIHAPLGNGFYGTSVYVDDEYMGSSIGTGSPAATASRYLLNQESLSLGGAHYGKDSSSNYSLLDEANFPVEEESMLRELTREIKWLNRRIKETITMDIYNYGHVLDFTERIAFHGHEYYLVSNRISRTVRELKQTITMVRWY